MTAHLSCIELLWRPREMMFDGVWAARDLQFVLVLAIAFMLLCVASIVTGFFRGESRLNNIVRHSLRYSAWAVLVLMLFPISCTLLARYGEFVDSFLFPALRAGIDSHLFQNLQNFASDGNMVRLRWPSCIREFVFFLGDDESSIDRRMAKQIRLGTNLPQVQPKGQSVQLFHWPRFEKHRFTNERLET